jgi:hypothetical protein
MTRGGGTFLAGAGGVVLGVIIIYSPAGPFVLVGGALMLAGGATGVSIGGAELFGSYWGVTTAEQDAELNHVVNTTMSMTSPGGLIGATIGLAATGSEEGLETGALYGNYAEGMVGVAQIAYGLGSMAAKEYEFHMLWRNSKSRSVEWRDVKGMIREVYGYADPATRVRANPLFPKNVERIDLSHFVPQRYLKGPFLKWLGNRPGNVRPMWATEHALVDPYRYRFMTHAFKEVYEGRQLRGLQKFFQDAPPWITQTGQGVAIVANGSIRRQLLAKP